MVVIPVPGSPTSEAGVAASEAANVVTVANAVAAARALVGTS